MSWPICDIVQVLNEDCQTVADDIKNPSNRVDRSADGKFHAFWRGQVVYQSGRIKEFETERDAREYLARCDAVDRILE